MTARYISGPLPRVLVELATAAASRPGITVKEWIGPAVYPDCATACKAAHSARTREGRADIHAEPGEGGWIVYMEPRDIMRMDGTFNSRRAKGDK